MANTEALLIIAGQWVNERDNFIARRRAAGSGLVTTTGTSIQKFDELVNGYARRVLSVMPADFTLAQLEALAELFASALNHARMVSSK